jgi:hypothetical protein
MTLTTPGGKQDTKSSKVGQWHSTPMRGSFINTVLPTRKYKPCYFSETVNPRKEGHPHP